MVHPKSQSPHSPTPHPITSEVLGSMESRHHQQGSLRQLVPDCGPCVFGWCHSGAGGCLCQLGDWEGSGGRLSRAW